MRHLGGVIAVMEVRVFTISGIAAGLWRSSARKYKEYALNPCCPACGRDLVDCLSEKMFARSKCKAKMEVGADG